MTYNKPECAPELAQVASALGLDTKGRSDAENAQAAIDEVTRIFAAIDIPRTLSELGLQSDKIEWTAQQAVGIERLIKNNPRPIDLAAMTRLIQAAYDGDLVAAQQNGTAR
jgi:alcohol dehydrogenase